MFELLSESDDLNQPVVVDKLQVPSLLAMSSKRAKKSKQDLDVFNERETMRNEENGTFDPKISTPVNNVSDTSNSTPKAPKRKKKSEGTEEVPKKVKKVNHNEGDAKKFKKKKVKNDSENKPMNGESEAEQKTNKNDSPEKKKEQITWPDQDIADLIDRMEMNIPEKDAMAYRSRVDKLNWENVAFKDYTAEECKKTWMQVQKRIRRFRLLRELLHDAKEWVTTPRTNHKLPKAKKHPDMPRRPLSSYLLFYLKEKDEIINEHPGLYGSDLTKIVGQIYKNLPPEKREKYEKLAATNREEYLEKLKIFFENHPEFVPPQKVKEEKSPKVEKEKLATTEKVPMKEKPPKLEKSPRNDREKPPKTARDKPKGDRKPGRPPKTDIAERPPKKCQTPFGLYFASELKNMEQGADKGAFRDKCKQEYLQMSDKKKVHWINLAEQDLIRYQEEVTTYKAKYPDYKVNKVRSILTKREKASKERASGKPVKPPNSAYALYSRVMLQSEEIKSVHPKDRMNYIAGKWKTCKEEEQNSYKDQVVHLLEQYKQDYQAYVDSLPEEERNNLLQLSKKSNRARTSTGKIRKPRKRNSTVKVQAPKPKFTEPEQPPISACKYFATVYKGEGDPVQVWKALALEEKRKYEDELVKKKQAYIVEFEKFLKSLSKEELEAFSKSRQQQVQSDGDESSDCSSESEGEEEEEDEDDGDEHNEENGQVFNEDEPHDSDSD